MKVLITGGTGFIGTKLTKALRKKGYEIVIVARNAPRKNLSVAFFPLDLVKESIPQVLLSDIDAIIHLAGRNIFGRWSRGVKQVIYESRVASTRNIISAVAKLSRKPKVFICASAVGYYGNRGDDKLIEGSLPGNDFLANVCVDWEKEAKGAEKLGMRTVMMRTAPVLGRGGLLAKLLPFYKVGLGGPVGSGKQWFPWIHIEDIVRAYSFALENANVSGACNASSPSPLRFEEFSKTLAAILRRPHVLRIPLWMLRVILNDVADAAVASQKVYPQKLLSLGFQFKFPDIKKALQNILLK